jgi:hypothetical protein
MSERCTRSNAKARGVATPAILLRAPTRAEFSLEAQGLRHPLVRQMGELASAMSCYAQTRLDAVDLRDAAARLFDVANRMSRADAERGART